MASNGQINNMLIPNISKLPKHKNVGGTQKITDPSVNPNEFRDLLKEKSSPVANPLANNLDRETGIQLSTHAARRLKERNLEMDSAEFFKLKDAFNKLKEKGGQDSLVITDKAAYIVDVPNQKVVTAIDKNNIVDNVFTKIDSTVLV